MDHEHTDAEKCTTCRREAASSYVAVKQRRLLESLAKSGLDVRGLETGDFFEVHGRCCENILGYKKVPLGISNRAVRINDFSVWVPLCTTEGALVASMCRGIKLINACGGAHGAVENLGITRGFALQLGSFRLALELYKWLPQNEDVLRRAGDATSRFLRVKAVTAEHLIGSEVFVKVHAYTGDAMGMNMVTKACCAIASYICTAFEGASLIAISSNTCTDKKWSAGNFVCGRGRRVSLNAVIDEEHCRSILHVGIEDILRVYHTKVVVGSSLVLGGHNCQASNYVAAVFLALGQDLGHVVESSNCILAMQRRDCSTLSVSVYMPSVIVGTVGGGTHLEPSRSFLQQFSKKDSEFFVTDRRLDSGVAPNYAALAVAAAVMAGELSGMAAIADNTLMDAHLRLNRE
eukprot:jgi/Antlo1/65/1258